MTDDERQDPDPTANNAPDARRLASIWLVVGPAAALLIGLLLGAVVVGVATDDDSPEGNAASPTASASPSATGSGDTTVTIPQECVEAARTVQEATSLIRENLQAISDFKAQRIVDLLNELEDLDRQAREQAATCRQVSVETSTATPTASESP